MHWVGVSEEKVGEAAVAVVGSALPLFFMLIEAAAAAWGAFRKL